MKPTVIILLFVSLVLPAFGQDFNTHWISAPQADSTSHVWFRKVYYADSRPRQASITVTSTGYYKLYVNECNVGTALFYPYRTVGDDSAVEMIFDITAYLRSGYNVVAIVYSPAFPSINNRQIAVNIFGRRLDGSRFCYSSDESWLCHLANSLLTLDGGEFIDGREHDVSWRSSTLGNLALWMPAFPLSRNINEPVKQIIGGCDAFKTSHITTYSPKNFITAYVVCDSDTIPYTYLPLPKAKYGFMRATVREAKKGEVICIGNVRYICNGKIDEQIYPLFTVGTLSNIPIDGDEKFKSSQITNLEAVEVKEQWIPSF